METVFLKRVDSMGFVKYLQDHEQHAVGNVVDLRLGAERAQIAAGICRKATNAEIDDAGGSGTPASSSAHTGTTGSIFFAGAGGAGSSPTEDNDNLFYDDTANALGIGTSATPTTKLHVKGAAATLDLLKVERTDDSATDFSLWVGEAAGIDLAVWGDGRVSINEAEATTNAMLRVNNPATPPTGGVAYAVIIDNNHVTTIGALFIDCEAATGDCIDVSSAVTTATGLDLQCDSLTTGRAAYIQSNSASTSTRSIVEIANSNVLADSAATLKIRQHADGDILRALNVSSVLVHSLGVIGNWQTLPIADTTETDVAPADDHTTKKFSIQKLASPPTNAAYLAFSNNPGSEVFYLVMEEGE
jgi:hypothetical protein